LKGIRIQAIVGELEGEKIDILKWDPDIKRYIANAMNPVKISRIFITDEDNNEALLVVPESQLSIAIGRQGQNIRLVSKLVGWKLDVITEKEFEQSEYAEYAKKAANELFGIEESEVVTLEDIPGVGPKTMEFLNKAGLAKIEDIVNKNAEELIEATGMSKAMANKLVTTISKNIEIVEEEVVKADEDTGEAVEEEGEKHYDCPNCGARITENMQMCPSCGVELEFKEEDEEEEEEEG
jgi:N utilization substance protein A